MDIQNVFNRELAAIAPYRVSFTDEDCTYLAVTSIFDNFNNMATFRCELIAGSGSRHLTKDVIVGGDDYQAWTGDNEFPYTYAAAQLGLTLL